MCGNKLLISPRDRTSHALSRGEIGSFVYTLGAVPLGPRDAPPVRSRPLFPYSAALVGSPILPGHCIGVAWRGMCLVSLSSIHNRIAQATARHSTLRTHHRAGRSPARPACIGRATRERHRAAPVPGAGHLPGRITHLTHLACVATLLLFCFCRRFACSQA